MSSTHTTPSSSAQTLGGFWGARSSPNTVIETYNVDGSSKGRILAQLGIEISGSSYIATKNNLKQTTSGHFQGAGIYAYQEIPQDLVDLLNSIRSYGGHTFNQQWSYSNGGDRTAPLVKTLGTSYNGVVWSPEMEKIGRTISPSYLQEDIARKPAERIGCRTSDWVVLRNKNTGKIYTVISVHGNSGPKDTKRALLLESLICEAHTMKYANPVIAGDMNLKPDTFYQIIKGEAERYNSRFAFKQLENYISETNKRKITNSNPDANFFERLDWVLFGNDITIRGEHIPTFANIPAPKPNQTVKQSDHVWVRYIVD